MNEEIKQILITLLGEDAFGDGTMKVSERTSKLVKSVSYLSTQLLLIKKSTTDDDTKKYIDEILESNLRILNK